MFSGRSVKEDSSRIQDSESSRVFESEHFGRIFKIIVVRVAFFHVGIRFGIVRIFAAFSSQFQHGLQFVGAVLVVVLLEHFFGEFVGFFEQFGVGKKRFGRVKVVRRQQVVSQGHTRGKGGVATLLVANKRLN